MSDPEVLEVESVELEVGLDEADSGEYIAWTPDAVTVVVRRDDDGARMFHSYASLEHLFLLLDQLERGESGEVLWGSSGILVEFADEQVTLEHEGIHLTGTTRTMIEMVEELVGDCFERIDDDGADTRDVAETLGDGRFAPWGIDPVAVHDRLVGGQ
jgi:hypothetical protein